MKKLLILPLLASIFSFNACKQQQLTILPGAVVSKDGTDDGLKNVKHEFNDATRTDEGIKFSLSSDVLFPSNSSYLTEKAKVELNKVIKLLKEQKGKKIRIDGHTDATGEEKYNIWLSEKRAASVQKFLEDGGFPSSRISTNGLGPNKPIADNKTAEGRQKNRRVEIVILK
ncbi:OmpA family protein [Sphingobacterium bovistauri]|uniref:OmpA family protein n=1 Tax=Sphingobacterium bovistauri TaxID=2781959 RepID=A0ABS7Z5R0_9SPHI|nr:OmpA family protein [Sphingobacterium bovistauri]MCA5005535.1 OmpA family protein [Sphingobacterium bovistauri]